jgi:type II secretory pathway predicted ATPase ExeA
MPAHFLNLKGAKTVATQQLLLTRQAITDLVELSAMGVVHGLAGTGKSFAVDAVLERERAIRPCLATFENYPTIRLVASTLVTAVLGADHQVRTRFQATPALVEALSNGPRLLVIDEAQQLNSNCIEYLRYLHDHQRTNFALLLVGGDGCWEVLSREPMLRSRIYRRVTFRPLSSQQVLDLLPSYHRIYQKVDGELLLFIDDNFAHGNFRNWASFTRSALDLLRHRRHRVLDEAVARNVFGLYGGGADAC